MNKVTGESDQGGGGGGVESPPKGKFLGGGSGGAAGGCGGQDNFLYSVAALSCRISAEGPWRRGEKGTRRLGK